ncbi:MAG: C45 family peptidase, partial [Bacteroidales bacterium]|nr:C45 family peptidase [Bacteroidales bacterium]
EANHGKMFMVKATPPSGVTFLVLTYPGILIGNGPGINNYGIAQTTNYIASMQWNTGVPRYFLNRAVLEAKSLDEAIKITTDPNRAFAYHHNLASTAEKRILSVEVTPYNFQIKEPKGIYFHTNHLILEQTKNLPQEDEYVKTSSLSRFSVISKNIKKLPSIKHIRKKDIMDILSSHENAPFSPCRHPEGNVKGRTLSTAIIDINNASIEVYKGNPCKSYPNNFFERYDVENF